MTSVLPVPVMAGRSCWHLTVCGFSSGLVRMFSECGHLLLQRSFLSAPVRGLKVQSTAEGKHHTNIIHQQTVLELLIIYPTTLLTITGTDLFNILRENKAALALATARGLEENQLGGVEATRLVVTDQTISDCSNWVSSSTPTPSTQTSP